MAGDDSERMAIQKEFGDRLRRLRESVGKSQAEVAHLAGLHPTYVSSVERGLRNVSLWNICRLASALDVEPALLVPGRRQA